MKRLIEGFVHKNGVHCESSAMRDIFEFNGFPMSEAMTFGLDATMGFGFFDTNNSSSFIPESDIAFFLGGKQGTIEANSLACRMLGITFKKQSFTSAYKSWEESKKMLDQNNPLILKVDLGYLAYFEIEGNVHFGGHAITLAGYDDKKEIAFIGDTKDAQGNTVSRAKLIFELIHGYIETWGTDGVCFRNLYSKFLLELLTLPELKEGPRAWKSEGFKIIYESLPIINESSKCWTLIADTLLNAVDVYNDDCLENVDLSSLHKYALQILSKEENLFNNLRKLKN